MSDIDQVFNPSGMLQAQCNKEAATSIAGYARPYQPNLTEKLVQQRAELQERLERIDAAIAALKSLPEFEAVLNAVSKAY